MNAIQFINEHGVDKAREVVEGAPEWASHFDGYLYSEKQFHEQCFLLSELKRLVESVYLVKEHHTLDRAIEYANSQYTAPEIKVCLLDAIADYRSIYGGEHV